MVPESHHYRVMLHPFNTSLLQFLGLEWLAMQKYLPLTHKNVFC
jgi:hypothetical protein